MDSLEQRRVDFVAAADRNVFVIMRYGEGNPYKALEKAVRETVERYGFTPHLARDRWFYDGLWENIEFYMRNSRYGIAVFERASPPDFNPNVAIELGYMLGMGKKCLILKDDTVPVFSDLLGRLFETFKPASVRFTVPPAIHQWMKGLGHQAIQPIETIEAQATAEAKKQRTRVIIGVLEELLKSPGSIVRQGGSLSSFAISADEGILAGEDQELKTLLLRERDVFCELISHCTVVRCLISPHIQVMSARLGILRREHLRSDVLPRIAQLQALINANLDNATFQIAATPRLPHDNVLIDDSTGQVFIGSRKLRESGFHRRTFTAVSIWSERR